MTRPRVARVKIPNYVSFPSNNRRNIDETELYLDPEPSGEAYCDYSKASQ